MKLDIKRFLGLLTHATAAIPEQYFRLPVAGSEDPISIYRERVYCYELYHCLRCVWPDEFKYSLSGEVDKRGHDLIRGSVELNNRKPDLLVHLPGSMEKNLVVIEVKPMTVVERRREITKDLETLTAFRQSPANYYAAIYLVYGNERGIRLDALRSKSKQLEWDNTSINLALINLYYHRQPGEPAQHLPWDN